MTGLGNKLNVGDEGKLRVEDDKPVQQGGE